MMTSPAPVTQGQSQWWRATRFTRLRRAEPWHGFEVSRCEGSLVTAPRLLHKQAWAKSDTFSLRDGRARGMRSHVHVMISPLMAAAKQAGLPSRGELAPWSLAV